jgi:hypothetical protein
MIVSLLPQPEMKIHTRLLLRIGSGSQTGDRQDG